MSSTNSTVQCFGTGTIVVGIGQMRIVQPPVKLRAVLGSCVGIVLYDPRSRAAGLAHSMLPEGPRDANAPAKYIVDAVDNLVAELIAGGSLKSGLRAHLSGGSSMFGASGTAANPGQLNIEAARRKLREHGIAIVDEHVGGTQGRRIVVDSATSSVVVTLLGTPQS